MEDYYNGTYITGQDVGGFDLDGSNGSGEKR
jgi:hypothetical protein